jgi:hypothetical protein
MGRVFCLVAFCLLPGCATPAAPGISGRWKPVNRFDAAPEEIPLSPAYVYYAAPMDRTLKTMLARWALDSKMALVYQHPSDFTLYEPVSHIRTGDLHEATAALTGLYAAQRVVVAIDDGAIVVRRAGSNVAASALSSGTPADGPSKPPADTSAAPATGGRP